MIPSFHSLPAPMLRLALLGLAFSFAAMASAFAQAQAQAPAGAASRTVVDYHTQYILEQVNANEVRPIASLTKIATACVALDWMERTSTDPGALFTVPLSAGQTGGANPLGLRPGDQISLRDALYAALLSSDNVAATALAHTVGADLARQRGRNDDPVVSFVREMNALAEQLDMRDTTFRDPHGLGDSEGKQSSSTANDLARLSIYAMGRSSFRFYSEQKQRTVTINRPEGAQRLRLNNTNELLGVGKIDGVKTGRTQAAGPCLIISEPKSALLSTNQQGQTVVRPRRLISIVLNSPNRFEEARWQLERGWQLHEAWVSQGSPVTSFEQTLRRAPAR